MPEVTIAIGGRDFDVTCQPGEEPFLEAAATLLDHEAQVLTSQIGRMPEMRMLLMAGLMLADKTAGLQDEVAELSDRLASAEALAEELRAREGEAVGGDAPAAEGPSEEQMARLIALAEMAETLSQPASDPL